MQVNCKVFVGACITFMLRPQTCASRRVWKQSMTHRLHYGKHPPYPDLSGSIGVLAPPLKGGLKCKNHSVNGFSEGPACMAERGMFLQYCS